MSLCALVFLSKVKPVFLCNFFGGDKTGVDNVILDDLIGA